MQTIARGILSVFSSKAGGRESCCGISVTWNLILSPGIVSPGISVDDTAALKYSEGVKKMNSLTRLYKFYNEKLNDAG